MLALLMSVGRHEFSLTGRAAGGNEAPTETTAAAGPGKMDNRGFAARNSERSGYLQETITGRDSVEVRRYQVEKKDSRRTRPGHDRGAPAGDIAPGTGTRKSMWVRALKAVRRYRVLIWLVVALVGLDRVVASQARRWDAYDPHPYRERLARCHEGRWDLLVVGGSPAMCGIDPAVLAGTPWRGERLETAFNLGLPLATAAEVWLAAKHGPKTPPRLLVYGASATDFNDSRTEESGPRQLMSLADLARAATARPKSTGWYAWNFGSECVARAWQLRYHRRGIRLCLADSADWLWPGVCPADAAEARHNVALSTQLRTNNGFTGHPPVTPALRLDAQKAAGQLPDSFAFMNRYQVGAAYLASLDRMLAEAARQGIPVLIVDMPVPADLDDRMYPAQFAAYRAALADAAAARGVPVLHATRSAVGLTDADFGDLIHVNGDGAAKLSAWLRTAVAAHGSLPPCGGGLGWGGGAKTPHPNPPPQGGRGQVDEEAAP
jgi:hypothetical protein